MATFEEHLETIARKILGAPESQIRDPKFLVGAVCEAHPATPPGTVASTALNVRLALDHGRMLTELRHAVQQSGEASETLQRAANKFSSRILWLTVFLVGVGLLQLIQIIRTW